MKKAPRKTHRDAFFVAGRRLFSDKVPDAFERFFRQNLSNGFLTEPLQKPFLWHYPESVALNVLVASNA
jgi:hypothetical protein